MQVKAAINVAVDESLVIADLGIGDPGPAHVMEVSCGCIPVFSG